MEEGTDDDDDASDDMDEVDDREDTDDTDIRLEDEMEATLTAGVLPPDDGGVIRGVGRSATTAGKGMVTGPSARSAV
jgi:hypothetical protein